MYGTSILVATLLAAFTSACPLSERDSVTLEARQGCTSYNYNQMGRDWASQCPSQWAQCGNGDQQSPINLPANRFANTHVPSFSFPGGTRVRGEIFNRGFGPEWVPASGAQVPRVTFDGQTFNLLQWHTHTPTSEHAVGGAKTRAEIHFVFGNGETPSAVFGVRMANGGASPMWNVIYGELDRQGRQLARVGSSERVPITPDFGTLLNQQFYGSGQYWTYRGSLTTPNCMQGLRWFVAGRNDALDGNQFQRLEAASINSVRDLQQIRNQQINQ